MQQRFKSISIIFFVLIYTITTDRPVAKTTALIFFKNLVFVIRNVCMDVQNIKPISKLVVCYCYVL